MDRMSPGRSLQNEQNEHCSADSKAANWALRKPLSIKGATIAELLYRHCGKNLINDLNAN
jgi:hypothetical protein